MTIRLANKTALPMHALAVAVDATGQVYETPAAVAPTLGPLAAIAWKEGRFAAELATLDGGDGGSGTLYLSAGEQELAAVAVDLSGGGDAVDVVVDLATVQGQTALRMALELDTAGGDGARAVIAGSVTVTQPLVESGC